MFTTLLTIAQQASGLDVVLENLQAKVGTSLTYNTVTDHAYLFHMTVMINYRSNKYLFLFLRHVLRPHNVMSVDIY